MKLSSKTRQGPANVFAYEIYGNCYLNLSNRCNLRCRFCPRMAGEWDIQDHNLRLQHEPDAAELLAAVAALGELKRFNEVVFCGLGEPTLRLETLLSVGRTLRARGVRVRLNTNGLANQYHGRDVTPELATAVDALSISLNAQNAAVYDEHCRPKQPGAYPALLDFIRRARAHTADVTVTAVAGLTGVDIAACARLATELGVNFRARTLDALG